MGVEPMKTIRQIAEEIGVTRQAIYYKIKNMPLSNSLQPFLSKENGILTVSSVGEKLIKQAFFNNTADKKLSKVYTSVGSEIINIFQEQLTAKDQQILELTAIIKSQTKSPSKNPKRKRITSKTGAPLERLLEHGKGV